MLKNTLSVAAATIAIVASASLPAAARPNAGRAVVSVPEPTSVISLIALAGAGFLTKNRFQAEKKGE